MIRLFEERGYRLIWGGTELYEKALQQEEELNEYPEEGYIREYDDYIVVKFQRILLDPGQIIADVFGERGKNVL